MTVLDTGMAFCSPLRGLISNRGRDNKKSLEERAQTPANSRSGIKTKEKKLSAGVLTSEEIILQKRRKELRDLRETLRNRKHLLAAQIEIPVRKGAVEGYKIEIRKGKSLDDSRVNAQDDWEDNLDSKLKKTHQPHSRESLNKFSKFIEARIEQTGEAQKVTSRDVIHRDPVQETLIQRLLELQPDKDAKKASPPPSEESSADEELFESEGQAKSQKPVHPKSQPKTQTKCHGGVCKVRAYGGEQMDEEDYIQRTGQKPTERKLSRSKNISRSEIKDDSKDRKRMDRTKCKINQDREGIAKSPRKPEGPNGNNRIVITKSIRDIAITRTREVGSWEEVDTIYKRMMGPEDSRKKPVQGAQTIHIATWNVNSGDPPLGFEQLLSLEQSPDVIVLGLQEVTMDPRKALIDYFFKDKWTLAVEETLKRRYTEVATKVVVSVALMVYVKRELTNSLREVEASSVTTGFGGFYGNKGGVMINFRLLGSRFGIVNSHLPAHDGEIEARIEDWRAIEAHRREITFDPRDYLFWMGDLNFRIALDSGWDAEEIARMAKRGMVKELLRKDELTQVKQQGLIFRGWNEAEIKFKPTFKVKPGTMGRFNLKRRPAWTDRILFKSETGKEIVNLTYESVDGFLESDHKPVVAEFQLKLH